MGWGQKQPEKTPRKPACGKKRFFFEKGSKKRRVVVCFQDRGHAGSCD